MPSVFIDTTDRERLSFNLTMLGFMIFMFFALFIMLDPFYTGHGRLRLTRSLGPLKYFPLIIGFAVAYFSLVGIRLRGGSSKSGLKETLVGSYPLLVFGLLVTIGSLYARYRLHIDETFLQLGIGTFGYFFAIVMFWAAPDGVLLTRRFMYWLLLVAMPFMIGWIVIKRIEEGQAFHTEIFLLVPLAVYAYLSFSRRWLAWLLILLTLAAGIASHKNTAYLVTLLVSIHLFFLYFGRRFQRYDTAQRAALGYFVSLLVLGLGLALAFLLMKREEYLPSGSVDIRSQTYTEGFNRFLDSPLWGTGFTDTTLVYLERIRVLGDHTVVTHSDILDIASHGGLLALGILSVALLIPLMRGMKALHAHPTKEERALIHGLGSMVAGGILVAVFNAPLLSLSVGLLFWFALGLLQGVATFSLRRGSAGTTQDVAADMSMPSDTRPLLHQTGSASYR